MQQVGTKAFFASARPVDPRSLPVPARKPARRALNGAGRAWVLHHRAITRAGLMLAFLGLAAIAWQLREGIVSVAATGFAALQGEFAHAGFAVGEIRMSGQLLTREDAILAALGVQPRTSTLSFDAAAARARIAELPAIDSVTIRKVYPADVIVEVSERAPVARWRIDGVTLLVDAQGRTIGVDQGVYGDLPLVIGDGAADDAMVMIRALAAYPELGADIVALSRIGNRRWDMIYDTGLRVQLPETGIAQALARLQSYQRDYALLDRDVAIVDLRVPHLVALRPARNEEDAQR